MCGCEGCSRTDSGHYPQQGEANLVFAAAPSQNELLAELLTYDIDWSKVRAFHQDEYIGITREEPAGFGNFLRRAIFDRVNFKEIHYLLCEGDDTPKKSARNIPHCWKNIHRISSF